MFVCLCLHVCVSSPVSGASHEVLIQRVPPLAPAGPVTHGGWEGELISPYIPATDPLSHTHTHTPRHTRRRHPSSAMPMSCTLWCSFLTLVSRRATNSIHSPVFSLLGGPAGWKFTQSGQFRYCQLTDGSKEVQLKGIQLTYKSKPSRIDCVVLQMRPPPPSATIKKTPLKWIHYKWINSVVILKNRTSFKWESLRGIRNSLQSSLSFCLSQSLWVCECVCVCARSCVWQKNWSGLQDKVTLQINGEL